MSRRYLGHGICGLALAVGLGWTASAQVVFETYSPYHHIRVIDQYGLRLLSFDGSRETQMSLADPLKGHFEYIEYFHMPWVWNRNIRRVLFIGLGGGSAQRAWLHYYTNTFLETVELDPVVIQVARQYFGMEETPRHQIHNQDGRLFVRRATGHYDALILDAYTTTRYGSSLPPHLVTREFFELARQRLTTNGVLACNVIGELHRDRPNMVGAVYRTLQAVFPRVYLFPARESQNVVLLATHSAEPYDTARVQREGAALVRAGIVRLPDFSHRLRALRTNAPPNAALCPVLTDDHAPIERLVRGAP